MSSSIVFDRAADFYDETRGFPPGEVQHAAALMARIGGLTPASRVIEVGVGTGRIALPLAPYVRAIVGVDLSRPMMERLRAKRAGEAVYPLEGDATRLPCAASVFDAAVAVHVFHLIAGWQEALRELARALRPEGVLLHGWNQRGDAFGPLWEAWHAVVPPDRRRRPGIRWEQQETFLAGQGWRLLREDAHRYADFQTPQTFMDRLQRRSSSSTWDLSDADVARGLAAVRQAAVTHFGDPARPVELEAAFHVQAYLPPS